MKALSLAERKARGAIFFDDDPGLTEQAHKDSCDINKIMAQYMKTGMVPVFSGDLPRQGDFSDVSDFHTAQCAVVAAQQAFDQLPAELRKEFNFDPGRFLEAIDDPDQLDRLVKLGVYKVEKASGEAVTPTSQETEGKGAPSGS